MLSLLRTKQLFNSLQSGISTKDQTIAGQVVNKNDRIFVDIGTANLNVRFLLPIRESFYISDVSPYE